MNIINQEVKTKCRYVLYLNNKNKIDKTTWNIIKLILQETP